MSVHQLLLNRKYYQDKSPEAGIWSRLILIFACILFLAACGSNVKENIVVKVDDKVITRGEIEHRINFNPYLRNIHRPNELKKTVLSGLIAERLVALQAAEQNFEDADLDMRISQKMKELMIEHLRVDSVEKRIEVTEQDIEAEYQKSIRSCHVQFVAFDSLATAQHFLNKIDTNSSYREVMNSWFESRGWGDLPIPEKTVSWAKEDFDLEDAVYSLEPGEVSTPVHYKDQYFLIKLISTSIEGGLSENEKHLRRPALEDRILRRKIRQSYRNFYERQLINRIGNVDWKTIHAALDLWTKNIDYISNDPDSKEIERNKPLSDGTYSNASQYAMQFLNQQVISFGGDQGWSFAELLRNLKQGPYVFNYSDERSFRRSFAYNIQLILEHEAIYKMALESGYSHKTKQSQEYNSWENFYKSNIFRHQMLKNIEIDSTNRYSVEQVQQPLNPVQEKRLDVFDSFLSNAFEKHKITIFPEEYNLISINKTDMVLMKSHMSNRLIMPLVEPLSGLPQWQKKIDRLFEKFGV